MASGKQSSARGTVVPRTSADPIQFLMDLGQSPASLAAAWGFRHSDAVYRLKRFEHVPKFKSAKRMAVTFGWTAGDVIDFWASRVEAKQQEAS